MFAGSWIPSNVDADSALNDTSPRAERRRRLVPLGLGGLTTRDGLDAAKLKTPRTSLPLQRWVVSSVLCGLGGAGSREGFARSALFFLGLRQEVQCFDCMVGFVGSLSACLPS